MNDIPANVLKRILPSGITELRTKFTDKNSVWFQLRPADITKAIKNGWLQENNEGPRGFDSNQLANMVEVALPISGRDIGEFEVTVILYDNGTVSKEYWEIEVSTDPVLSNKAGVMLETPFDVFELINLIRNADRTYNH